MIGGATSASAVWKGRGRTPVGTDCQGRNRERLWRPRVSFSRR